MSLPDRSVGRPIAVMMATLAVSVFGFLALSRLPVELLPDLSYPTLTIQTEYPDAAPVSVEQFVTRPVEEGVGVIPGVRDMRSTSRAGVSEVVLEFEWDQSMDVAAMDVREKLGLVELPREATPPRVLRFDPSLDPIVRLALTGDRPLDDLRQVAERWVKPRLEAVQGVAAAKVRGGLDPEIHVEADEDRLAAQGLTLDDLAAALRSENVNQPGGTVKDWGAVYLIRTLNEFEDLDGIRRTTIRAGLERPVRLEDVATVTRSHRDREEITRSGGREGVEIALHREGSQNTVAVAEAIQEELGGLREEMSKDLRIEVLDDQSRYIADAIGQVWWAAIAGGALAILVLFFFLGELQPTAIIALTIPISVLATFLPMYWGGVTLNIMSLGGLALGVGNLVDNSIVVLEAMDRHRKAGRSRREAAALGAGEVAGAVTSSTLTTVAVFLPIVFVQGIAGQLFHDLSVTICVSQVASLIVGLTLIPALAAIEPGRRPVALTLFTWDGAPGTGPAQGWWTAHVLGKALSPASLLVRILRLPIHLVLLPFVLALGILEAVARAVYPWVTAGPTRTLLPPIGDGRAFGSVALTVCLFPVRLMMLAVGALARALWWAFTRAFRLVTWPAARAFDALQSAYPRMLARALTLRFTVLPVAFGAFALALGAIPLLGTQLVPDLAQGEFAFRLRLPQGMPLQTTSDVVQRIERPLTEDPRFERVFSVVGSLPSAASGQQTQGENLAQINFVLPPGAGADDEQAAVARVRRVLGLFPDLHAEIVHPSVLTLRPPVAVQLFAEDLGLLDRAAELVAGALRRQEGLSDLATTVEPGSPEVRVELDRERAASLGVTAEQIAAGLRRKIAGEVVGQYREQEHRLDIRLRVSEASRDRASHVEALRIRLPGGNAVPVSSVARVTVDRGPAAVHHAGGARMAEVTAKATGADLGRTLDRVRASVRRLALPAGASAELAGQDEDLTASFGSLRLALALAIFLVYVVMAVEFESLLHPFVILLTVPLGVVGVILALLVTRTAVDVLVLIGAVMLSGIVVNNAIVLVDAVNRRRREGQALDRAIVSAGRERLRPILMTTSTTVLGLLPLALGLGAGAELQRPLAITVIGGLSAATMLTLIVIPCLYRAVSGAAAARRPTEDAAAIPGIPEVGA